MPDLYETDLTKLNEIRRAALAVVKNTCMTTVTELAIALGGNPCPWCTGPRSGPAVQTSKICERHAKELRGK